MTEQATTTEINPWITDEMRDVLVEMGFDGARTAPAANVHKKIAAKFGSVENWMVYYGH